MKKATLCFVVKGDKILMINREKPPFMGMWNGVGGHLEEEESVETCAIREIKEESGITVKEVKLFSTFTWNYDDEIGYALLSELPDDFDESRFPLRTEEGIIEFKKIDWVISEKNCGVIEDLKIFINDIKNNNFHDYHLVYDGTKLIEVIIK